MDAVPDTELQVAHHHVGVGEVDDRLGAALDEVGQGVVAVPGVDPGDQLEVVGGLNRPADLGADLPAGPQDADLHPCAHAPNLGHRRAPGLSRLTPELVTHQVLV